MSITWDYWDYRRNIAEVLKIFSKPKLIQTKENVAVFVEFIPPLHPGPPNQFQNSDLQSLLIFFDFQARMRWRKSMTRPAELSGWTWDGFPGKKVYEKGTSSIIFHKSHHKPPISGV